jgi:FtsP/CotA-like multicopper oxidase with cupredoxin domain/fibronectin type 3 domain-containing protein
MQARGFAMFLRVMSLFAVLCITVPAAQAASKVPQKRPRITAADQKAAASRAAAEGLVLPAPGMALMATPGSPPHYFGPFANYANSPLPVVNGTVISVGNPLVARQYATDAALPAGARLAPVLVVVPTPLPNGLLQAFQTFNQATPGGGTSPSAGNLFHAYVLRPTANPGEYLVAFDSGELTVPATTDPVGQEETFAVPNVPVQAGDVIAFYGQGIPLDIGGGADTLSFPADTAPVADGTITLGGAGFPIYPEARTYSFRARVLDLSGANVVATGGIRKFVNTLPGLGAGTANDLGQYIPVAVPDTTTYPGSDYYEIALVQYREKMHTDLPPTLLRGYVQLSTAVVPGARVPLFNTDGSPITLPDGQQATAVDAPHYLGPAISATKNKPVRILFRNLLPKGQGGDLFLPVDTTVMGSGRGPNIAELTESFPRTPLCGQTPKDPGCYTENRATLHLHGGITPWISDGTPHQWITPAGEGTPYPQGVSVANVPDMPDPGPGAQTFFYTNQQSARLLFYHDHSWGITRLNVYAGEAAPYLITDEKEQSLVTQGVLPIDQIPLVIQDKTFVPDTDQLSRTDPLWDLNRWGGLGNLWLPHVYMPAQNPGDSSGVNQFGRWAYGPWFWPPTSDILYPPIDNPYFDPTCDPNATWCEPPLVPGTPNVSMGMESFHDTPLVNGTPYPTVTVDPKAYRLRILNASNDRFFNLSLYQADGTGTEVALNAAEVAAALADTTVFPTPDTALSPEGPPWIQIGTEGGFLPAPVVIPPHVTTWVNDPTVFNAGNVDQHSLLLGPAERADVIVDFSSYAGKTLIVYNDAPAAFPARDARYDYYTGNADLTAIGGAPSTLPGYGPNTRTIMQIKVSAAAPQAFPLAPLEAAFKHQADGSGVFESSQHPIVVGQGAYNSAYGTSFQSSGPRAGLAQIYDEYLAFDTVAGVPLTMPLERKAIQDEMGEAFEREYGRMSGNLGLEAPNAQAGQQQNLILYPYVNPATEILDGIELPPGVEVTPITSAFDGTQLWKITHNGVDTHPIHFHLFDVQLINRVGWDGIIRKPEPTELGWKDTVRISPLEDTIVAMRPIIPKLPFGLLDSVRPLNPAMPIGSMDLFNSVDAFGNPITPAITNQVVNFGWEYVWHCHILSHEEMDMMRPISVNVARTLPVPPAVTLVRDATTGVVNLSWTDGTPVSYAGVATWGDPANEVGFRIERAVVAKGGKVGNYSEIGRTFPNTTAYRDATAVLGTSYSYRVVAFNAAGSSASAPVGGPPDAIPSAPSGAAASLQSGLTIAVTWRDNSRNESFFRVERSVDAGTFAVVATPPAGTTSFTDTAVQAGRTYRYRVAAVNSGGTSTFATSNLVTVPAPPPAPSGLTGSASPSGNKANVSLSWTDNASTETGFELQRATNASFTVGLTTTTVGANTVTNGQTGLYRGVTYFFRVRAANNGGTSAWSNVFTVVTP